MGKRGPKPTPTAQLRLRGSWRGKAREKQGEPIPSPVPGVPDPPAFLGARGQEEWRRQAPALVKDGVLTDRDMTRFASMCQAFDQFWECCDIINRDGLTQVGFGGGTVAHPLLVERNRAWSRYQKESNEFGLSPCSRPNLRTNPAQKKNEAREKFFKKGG